MFDVEKNLNALPDSPGVYIHKDELGQVIYVGKAISLRKRVRQYFRTQKNRDPKVRALVGHIAEFEYITCSNEMEALILECNLIKKYMPRYNVLLRDDKTYPYIKVTIKEDYPRIVKTRIVERDGSKYFGPYSDAGAVNLIIDLLNDTYSLKRCAAKKFAPDTRACLNHHIGKCSGVCISEEAVKQYAENLAGALDFLNGKRKPLLKELQRRMEAAAENLEFEEAAAFRDKIAAAEAIAAIQHVAIAGAGDMDVILPLRTGDENYAVMFSVRSGKLSARETFRMHASSLDDNAKLVSNFIMQHYSDASADMTPPEIIVEDQMQEKELIEEYLFSTIGKRVRIIAPKKGDKKALIDLARNDVRQMGHTIDERLKAQKQRVLSLNDELCKILSESGQLKGEKQGDYRIEAYDISNTSGVDTVAGMVVFFGMRPSKKAYRRFRVKSVQGPDDYTALKEVIYRRFRRAEMQDAGFSVMPDILLIDGGKGQISAVSQVLSAMKVDIPIFGMAKDDRHRTRALVYAQEGSFAEIDLQTRPLLFKFIGSIQEEVHRFAIDYHRKLRDSRVTSSVLDNIEGVGPVKRNALLAHFGSIEAIKSASIDDLRQVAGITEKNALKIKEYFNC